MKKFLFLVVLAVLSACADVFVDENLLADGKYTLTVEATKGGNEALTKALGLSGSTLNATWTLGDVVKVYKGGNEIGELTAQSNGATTKLRGSVTTAPSAADVLTLKYLSPAYSTQDGTLETIATTCDYAVASVTVTNFVNGNIFTSAATFENQQAIVKFILKDIATGNPSISATKLSVTAGETTITVTPSSATDDFFVAIPAISAQAVSLSANITPGYVYTYEKPSATFANSQYYEVTVKMTKQYADLGLLTADFVAVDGDVLKNSLNRDVSVAIANNATVTLSGIYIYKPSSSQTIPGITCNGNSTIILADGTSNSVEGRMSRPGIYVSSGNTLTIQGTGTLRAFGDYGGAGIGGASNYPCGNIRIEGGNIYAYGSTRSGNGAAGIGGGPTAEYGDITITGGTITAYGYAKAAGIGGGYYGYANSTITISGGSVTAQGGADAAAIGAGYGTTNYLHYCGSISITGGTVTATCGTGAAAVIGRSSVDNGCGDITISGSPSVTLNNPNNSGFPVELSSFINTGKTIYLAQMVWEPSSSLEYSDANTWEDNYYHVEFGCLTAQQFVYRPTN